MHTQPCGEPGLDAPLFSSYTILWKRIFGNDWHEFFLQNIYSNIIQVDVCYHTDQRLLAGTSGKNWSILLMQSFTACIPFLTAHSEYGKDAKIHYNDITYTISTYCLHIRFKFIKQPKVK